MITFSYIFRLTIFGSSSFVLQFIDLNFEMKVPQALNGCALAGYAICLCFRVSLTGAEFLQTEIPI